MSDKLKQIRILSYNIQGKMSKTTEDTNITKVSIVLEYMKNNKYDIVCLQETKAPTGWMNDQAHKINPTYQVVECANTDNNNKGGVAIICINPKIKLNKVILDNELPLNWATQIPLIDRPKIEEDSITGKFMQASFLFDGHEHHIVNVYGPTLMGNTNSYFARSHFYKFLNDNITQHEGLIMIGDYNNVLDPKIDIIRTGPYIDDKEDITDLFRWDVLKPTRSRCCFGAGLGVGGSCALAKGPLICLIRINVRWRPHACGSKTPLSRLVKRRLNVVMT